MTPYSKAFIDQHRDINVGDHYWHSSIYNDFHSQMGQIGIASSRIYFSGFWSQGDGACFDGSVVDHVSFMKAHGLDAKYPAVMFYVTNSERIHGRLYAEWSHNHRVQYYHEKTLRYEFEYSDYRDNENDTDLRAAVIDCKLAGLADQMEELGKDVQRIVENYCRELYRTLKQEHEYLTSDEAVVETLTSCGIEEEAEPIDSTLAYA